MTPNERSGDPRGGERQPKKPYIRPVLIQHGTVVEMTKADITSGQLDNRKSGRGFYTA